MNIQELKGRFKEVADSDAAIETFFFDDLASINTNRQKKYPVVLLKTPNTKTDGFSLTANTQQLDDYTINFYVLKPWTKEDKKTIGLEQRYKETNEIGNNYLREFLIQGSNNYYLTGTKTVNKSNGHHQHVDQLVGTQFTFTLRVSNVDNCTL